MMNGTKGVIMKKKARKTVSLVVAVIMALTMMPGIGTFSFADESDSVKTEAAAEAKEVKQETKKEEPKKEEPKQEAPKQEEPKSNDPEPAPEPKATEPEESDQTEEVTEETQATSENGEEPEVVDTDPTDPTKLNEDKEDEEEKMPAQSFSGSAGGVSVKASAEKGVFPKGTKMKVSPVSSAYVIKAANAAMGDNFDVVDAAAVDINFYKDGNEIQPKDGSVSVRLNAGSVGGEEQEAVHVTSGGGVQVIGGASSGSASFSASHFSIYGIIGGEYGDDVEKKARYTYVFKVNGQEVDRQVVINGEQVTAPADPKVSEGKFKGWMIEGQSTPLSFPYTVTIPDDEDEDREFVVNASIAETFTATFWKNEGKTEILETKEGAKDEYITTSDVTWRFADGTAIIGWTLNGQPVTSFKITENVELLPIVSGQVCEVSFETGEGSPIPTVFVEKGKRVAKPADPVRSGYEFKGWFTDSACTKAYDFTAQVNADLRLYAKWEGQQTIYKVVHWRENANDDSYTVSDVESKNGKAGETATFTPKSYDGFTLNTAKSNEVVIVKGDGTTIKNVYYDRKTYPFILYKVEVSYEWWDILQLNPIYESTQIAKKDFKYQEETSTWFNQITSQYPDQVWYTQASGTTAYTAPPPMQPAGGGSLNGFTGLSAYGRTAGGTSYVLYLDNANPTTEIRPAYQGGRTEWHFTDEDHIIIPGWTFACEGKVGYETYNGKREYVGRLYYTRNNYKLSFDPQDGTQTITVNNVPFEAALAGRVPSSPKVGDKKTFNGIEKTFAGWFDNEACLGAPVNFSTMKMPALSNNGDTLMFYGKWMNETHTVSFDLDGGQYDGAGAIEAQEVESGNQATAPDAGKMSKTDPVFGTMTFGGWQDNSGKRFSFDTRITSDIVLKAIWNTDKTQLLTVQYDTNGGEGSFSDGNKYQDGAHAIIKGQPVAEDGKYFVGWKVGNSDVILASGSFQVKLEDADTNKVVKLTAQYADKPSYPTTVIYNANGGKFGDDSITIEDTDAVVNGNYTVKGYKPTREGHTFKGWALTTNALAAVYTAGQKVASGKDGNVLYAVYELNKTSVTVTITGKTAYVPYDGKEHSISGYDVKITGSDVYTKDDFKFTGNAVAKGTKPGVYPMGLSEKQFVNNNENFDVKFIVEDGELKINGTVLDDEEEPKKNKKSMVLDESDAPDRDDSQVKGDSETKSSNGNGTKTGDAFLPALYMILMLIAMAVTSGVIIRRKLMSR